MDELTDAQIKAGLAVFEDWRSAPLGISFGDVVANIYRAMSSSEPHVVTFRPPEVPIAPVPVQPEPITLSEQFLQRDAQPEPTPES